MAPPDVLNLGCGLHKFIGAVNVDAYAECNPDVVLDLTQTPWPWPDNSFDEVLAFHVLEHLPGEWWPAFCEAARVLKPGGILRVHTPHESSATALGWRDHHHIFTTHSFHGISGKRHGTSAWALHEADTVPLELVECRAVPYPRWQWMPNRLLAFVATHMRNFIHESRFIFRKLQAPIGGG